MRTLIVGASGQVGSALMATATARDDCLGTFHRSLRPGLVELDLHQKDAIRQLLVGHRPEICFLSAAWTNLELAERLSQECYAVNAGAAEAFARVVRELGGLLVFLSTDHVFPARDTLWREDEPVSPVSVYARTKAEGEHWVRTLLPDQHLIIRTSWVFGQDTQGKNFVYRVRDTLARGETLTVPGDQWGQPTFSTDLAQTAWELVARQARGTFHVVGSCWLDRASWARRIATTIGCDSGGIVALPTISLGQVAPRPLRVGLDRSKLLAFLGYDPIRGPEAGVTAALGV